jgi:4a-hydroxytetrahydrobiopterin dehydratase
MRSKPLSEEETSKLAREIPNWEIGKDEIKRTFNLGNFKAAIGFVNHVAEIAERENHHPEIEISYSKVEIELKTHSVGGLSINDFILAAKIDRLVGLEEDTGEKQDS